MYRCAVFLPLLLLLAAAPLPAAAQITATSALQQPSYPLVCRGGPAMRLVPEAQVGGIPSTLLLIRFTRAVRGAADGVRPGTCAWQERGVATDEPAALCFARLDHLLFEMTAAREVITLRVRAWAGTTSMIFLEGGERPDGNAARLGDATQPWFFRARHDTARGCLLVTHVGV